MTLSEWVKQITKEVGNDIYEDQVWEVMIFAIRTGIEELLANPEKADVYIPCIGRFYLNFSYVKNVFHDTLGVGKEGSVGRWKLKFKASRVVLSAINGKSSLYDMEVSRRYLYPEMHEEKEKKVGNGYIKEVGQERERCRPDSWWIKRIDGMLKGEWRYRNGKFSKVLNYEEYEKEKKRLMKLGRPANHMDIDKIIDKVNMEMKRDLKRELRQLKQGKITEDELRMAKW